MKRYFYDKKCTHLTEVIAEAIEKQEGINLKPNLTMTFFYKQ